MFCHLSLWNHVFVFPFITNAAPPNSFSTIKHNVEGGWTDPCTQQEAITFFLFTVKKMAKTIMISCRSHLNAYIYANTIFFNLTNHFPPKNVRPHQGKVMNKPTFSMTVSPLITWIINIMVCGVLKEELVNFDEYRCLGFVSFLH